MAGLRVRLGRCLVVGALALAWRPALAGEYHVGGMGLLCSDCHTMHSSRTAQVWQPTPYLLKHSGEVPLCMSCHDGSEPRAPDIVSNGTSAAPDSAVSTPYASKYGSSAGFFQGDYLSAPSRYGHDLVGPVTAPLSTTFTRNTGLACSDCHNPHGTPNYRNLVSDPNPAHPGSFSIVLGTNVTEAIPVDTASPNPAAAYDTGNVGLFASNNFRGWCTDCHDQLAQDLQGASPAHFARHPSDVGIGGSYSHSALGNWLSGTVSEATGFGTEVGDSAAGIPRVRYGSANGSSTVAAAGDTVTCLSCHKAHGSAYRCGLVWPYQTDTPDSLSACQQCHFK